MYGSDYIIKAAEVIFPITAEQGDTECINITIVEDDVLECDHYFFVYIVYGTLGTDITGSPNVAVIKIVDNDSKIIGLSMHVLAMIKLPQCQYIDT